MLRRVRRATVLDDLLLVGGRAQGLTSEPDWPTSPSEDLLLRYDYILFEGLTINKLRETKRQVAVAERSDLVGAIARSAMSARNENKAGDNYEPFPPVDFEVSPPAIGPQPGAATGGFIGPLTRTLA